MLDKINNYLAERKKWKEFGSPERSSERIKELFDICNSNQCGQYIKISDNHGQCGLCKCHLKLSSTTLNKLAFATTRCPNNPPYWVEEDEFNPDKKQNEVVEETPSPPPPIQGPCGCGG